MIAVDSLKVKRACNGDSGAFAQLIQERKSDIFRMIYAYVKNQEDALDIMHDGIYKAYLSIRKLKNPEYFNTWIVKIMINTCIDHLKKDNKKKQNENPYYQQDDLEQLPIKKSIEKEVISQIDLFQAMDQLNEELKAIVILKYYQDLTLIEISEVLNTPIGTIKSRLNRALTLLRVQLKEEYYEKP